MTTTDRRGLIVGDQDPTSSADLGPGLAWKVPVIAATTANITLSGLQTIDAVVLVEGDRVLVSQQTDQKTNGIYTASAGAWTRAVDFDESTEILCGTQVLVTNGTDEGGHSYRVTTANPIVIDTSNIVFSLVTSALPDSFTEISITDASGSFTAGPTTATAGSTQAIDWMWGTSAAKTLLVNEAGIWTGKVYSGLGFSKKFTSANDSAVADTSPNVGLFVLAENAGANNDAVAILGDTLVSSANKTGFGGNFVVRNATGIDGTKLVGLEIDVVFATGTTAGAGSGGLYLNIFNRASAGPAIQLGGVSSGTWTNGLVLDGIASTGAGVSPNAGTTMGSLINTGTATYSSDAAIFSNTHAVRFNGTASVHATLKNDASGNFRLKLGDGGFFVRNSTDAINLYSFASSGAATFGQAGAALGTISLTGDTSGTVSIKPQAIAGTFNFNLPITAGASGSILLSGGGVASPMTWLVPGTGVATALAINVGSAGAFVTFNGALGTPSSGIVTNLTGTASININGTVGATSQNSGQFTSVAYSTTLTGTSTNANALAVGRQGATNPVLQVDASTATVATGLKIKGAAAAGGLALSVITSGTNENLTLDAAGSGTITIGGTSTGAITLTRAATLSAALTYGGVTLANSVTGTGSMVLSAAPTFTGTTTIAALSVTGITALSAGNNTTPSLHFGDTGTGFYRQGTNTIGVASGGTAIWTFFSNGNFLPLADNGFAIGASTNRPSAVYGVAFFSGTGLQAVGARKTGWAVATGTPTRTTFDTATVTLPLLAERVKALIDDLHATAGHGLIGT